MLLKIEKTHASKSLDKMDVVPGEMVTFHIQQAPEAPWESYAMSAKFLHRLLTHYQSTREADEAMKEIQFKPINGHSFLGVDDDTESEA